MVYVLIFSTLEYCSHFQYAGVTHTDRPLHTATRHPEIQTLDLNPGNYMSGAQFHHTKAKDSIVHWTLKYTPN